MLAGLSYISLRVVVVGGSVYLCPKRFSNHLLPSHLISTIIVNFLGVFFKFSGCFYSCFIDAILSHICRDTNWMVCKISFSSHLS